MEEELKRIKEFFLKRKEERPEYGDYINLCYTLHHSGASREECKEAFYSLVSKDSYDKPDVEELINYLFEKASEIE